MLQIFFYSFARRFSIQISQQISGVGIRLDLGHDFFNHSLLVNEIGRAHNAHADLAVELFLLPDAVFFDDFMLRIGKKNERKAVFFSEFAVGFGGILADADDDRIKLFEFLIRAAKSALPTAEITAPIVSFFGDIGISPYIFPVYPFIAYVYIFPLLSL